MNYHDEEIDRQPKEWRILIVSLMFVTLIPMTTMDVASFGSNVNHFYWNALQFMSGGTETLHWPVHCLSEIWLNRFIGNALRVLPFLLCSGLDFSFTPKTLALRLRHCTAKDYCENDGAKETIQKTHVDEHYCAAMFRYLWEHALMVRDNCLMVCLDDKHRLKVGKAGFPIAAVERVLYFFRKSFKLPISISLISVLYEAYFYLLISPLALRIPGNRVRCVCCS